jgi:aminopeptidase N
MNIFNPEILNITCKPFIQPLRRGLSNYLQDKKFQAAEQDDLWRHLTQQGHRDGTVDKDYQVKTIMDTWTLQMGFPVVNVERNYQDNSAILTQKRFFLSQKESVSEDEDYKWWIPITFTHPGGDFSNTYSNIWMKENQRNIQVSGLPHQNTAVIFNVQETG